MRIADARRDDHPGGCVCGNRAGAGRGARRIQQHGVEIGAVRHPGGGIGADELGGELEPRQILLEPIEPCRRAIDEACELGARCLVMVVGGIPEHCRDIAGARALVEEGLR